jgi:hypothetical protein
LPGLLSAALAAGALTATTAWAAPATTMRLSPSWPRPAALVARATISQPGQSWLTAPATVLTSPLAPIVATMTAVQPWLTATAATAAARQGWPPLPPPPPPGGSLSVTAPATLRYVATLGGTDRSLAQPATLGLDSPGAGGWHLTVVSTALRGVSGPATKAGAGATGWQLRLNGSSTAASSLAPPPVRPAPGSTPPRGNSATYPVPVPGLHGRPGAVPALVYSVAPASGIGRFRISAFLWLTVPADALAGRYQATVTWAVATGP